MDFSHCDESVMRCFDRLQCCRWFKLVAQLHVRPSMSSMSSSPFATATNASRSLPAYEFGRQHSHEQGCEGMPATAASKQQLAPRPLAVLGCLRQWRLAVGIFCLNVGTCT